MIKVVRLYRAVTASRSLSRRRKLRVCLAMAWQRGFANCVKKEKTWCDALEELCSQIKYSPAFLLKVIRRAVALMACCTKTDCDSNPNVFNLNTNGVQLKLNGNNAKPGNRWNSDNELVFCSRKYFLSAALWLAVFLFRIIQAVFPTAQHFADFI